MCFNICLRRYVHVFPLTVNFFQMDQAGLAMLHFVRCRRNFSTHLKDSNCGLTGARYFRLMSMAVALMTWALIVTVVDMWFRYQSGWQPWNNWAEVHSHFSLI